jgi:predicted RND superfamily exporter protein
MNAALLSLYNRIVLGHPVACLLSVLLLVLGIGWFARDFRLDASADSLVLENDADLRYYREVRQRYVSDDFLVAGSRRGETRRGQQTTHGTPPGARRRTEPAA